MNSARPFRLLILLAALWLQSCDEVSTPKPRGYFRITMPEKTYQTFDPGNCPFTFSIPSYAAILRDTNPSAEPCWMNVEFTPFKGTVYLSYKAVNGNLDSLIEDCRSLALKHIPKASGIEEAEINIQQNRVYGITYTIKGNAASPLQFWLTDSMNHFIRGSLYYYAVPNQDSIAPVQSFVKEDIERMLGSFRWK